MDYTFIFEWLKHVTVSVLDVIHLIHSNPGFHDFLLFLYCDYIANGDPQSQPTLQSKDPLSRIRMGVINGSPDSTQSFAVQQRLSQVEHYHCMYLHTSMELNLLVSFSFQISLEEHSMDVISSIQCRRQCSSLSCCSCLKTLNRYFYALFLLFIYLLLIK